MGLALVERPDGTRACGWSDSTGIYAAYHDTEWAVPITNDDGLFERMCLEGFQSGLSWLTVLRKRPNFRAAFSDFSIDAVASFDDADVERLLADAGIIRHRGKIEATINNARAAQRMRADGQALTPFFWSFAADQPQPPPERQPDGTFALAPTSPASHAMSKQLKAAGWRFVGPTTCYSLMQAVGIVNDHLPGCARREPIAELRAAALAELNRASPAR